MENSVKVDVENKFDKKYENQIVNYSKGLLGKKESGCGLKIETGKLMVACSHDEVPVEENKNPEHEACLSEVCDDCPLAHNDPDTMENNKNLLERCTNPLFRDEDVRMLVRKTIKKGAKQYHDFCLVAEEQKIYETHQKKLKKESKES